MKKTCISISLIFILFLSSITIVPASETIESKNKPCEICSNIEKTYDPMSDYEASVGAYGIKIWARGFGELNSDAIDDVGDRWTQVLRYPETAGAFEYYNSFNYAFYDENAETRVNALVPIGPFGMSLIMMVLFPNVYRFNTKIPLRDPGPHKTSGSGTRLQGYISKGQTFDGTPVDPIIIGNITYPFYEIRGRCTYLPLESPAQSGDIIYLLSHSLKWKNDPDFIPWDCCHWED